MKIKMKNRLNEFVQSLEEHIQCKPRLALSKVAAYFSSITFIIFDVIGQTGKNCSLTPSLYHMPNIAIEETHTDIYFVIDPVIRKATRTVSS